VFIKPFSLWGTLTTII